MNVLPKLIREAAELLTGSPRDYDPLLDLVGDAHFVLLGEATRSTHEFYRERGQITTCSGPVTAVSESTEVQPEHKDLDVAIRDAFASARRQLQDYVKRMRGEVKAHPQSFLHGFGTSGL